MFGSNEFEEAKIGAVFLTMEDALKLPYAAVFGEEICMRNKNDLVSHKHLAYRPIVMSYE